MTYAKLSALAGLALTALVATTAGLGLAAVHAPAQERAGARSDPDLPKSDDPNATPVEPNIPARQDDPASPLGPAGYDPDDVEPNIPVRQDDPAAPPAPSDPFAGPSDDLALPVSDPYAAPILEVRFTQAERKLNRAKTLHKKAIISIEEVQLASDDLALLLAQAEARRDDLRDLVERLKVRVAAAEASVEAARVRHEITSEKAKSGFGPSESVPDRREVKITAATLRIEEARLREVRTLLAQSTRRLSAVEDLLSRHGAIASQLVEPTEALDIPAPSPRRR